MVLGSSIGVGVGVRLRSRGLMLMTSANTTPANQASIDMAPASTASTSISTSTVPLALVPRWVSLVVRLPALSHQFEIVLLGLLCRLVRLRLQNMRSSMIPLTLPFPHRMATSAFSSRINQEASESIYSSSNGNWSALVTYVVATDAKNYTPMSAFRIP